MTEDWQADLERWLSPFLEGLGNTTRRRMCPAYIAGPIGPAVGKSSQQGEPIHFSPLLLPRGCSGPNNLLGA